MGEYDDVVAAWAQATQALVDLGRACSDGDFERATECPGWTVKDQLSHVVGVERWMQGEAEPRHELPDLPHVHGDFGRRVEVAVDLRRGVPGPQVVDELAMVRSSRLRALGRADADPRSPTVNPLGGTMPLVDVLRMRTFDVWTHEQDVRRALGRPGDLDSAAAAVAVAWVRRGLPRVVARGARVEPGRVAVVDVRGAGGFRDAVTVTSGDDGRPAGLVLPQEPAAPDAVLTLTTEAFMRRSCGRWPAAGTPVEVAGDAGVAARVLEAMAVTP
ncbi:MAG: maleylpyruvate isomerase family mycothiol-dependent enzyme [Actinomycetes bacterium]